MRDLKTCSSESNIVDTLSAILSRRLMALSVVVVSHEFTHGPQHNVLEFLLRKAVPSVAYVAHSLPDFTLESESTAKIYDRGRLTREIRWRKLRAPESVLYAKDILIGLLTFFEMRRKFHVFVGNDSINTIVGLLLKRLGRVEFVIYYGHSYLRRRFDNPLKNLVYHIIDTICVRFSDSIWSVTRKLRNMRSSQLAEWQTNVWVPEVLDMRLVKPPPEKPRVRTGIVFLGHLKGSSGVELIVEAMQDVTNALPDARLTVIGIGPSLGKLKRMARELGLEDNMEFLGYLEYVRALHYMRDFAIGLAPYAPDPKSNIWTADPSKPKDYAASGLAVITTRTGESALEIEKRKAGVLIGFDRIELANAIIRLLTDDQFLMECRRNAWKLAQDFDLEVVYPRVWEETFEKWDLNKIREDHSQIFALRRE